MDHPPGGSQIFWKYLVARPSRQVKELFLSTTIMDFAVAAITIFEPIYLSKIGFSIPQILLFYLGVYGLYFILQPLGGKVTRSRGYEQGIILSTPFLVLYYLSLFAIPYSPLFVVTAVLAFAVQKTLYWPGFHADFARFGSATEQGKEFGVLVFFLSIASVAGPFFGGLVLKFFGFPALFVLVSLIILASNIPLLITPEVFTPRELSYRDAYKRLFKPQNRRLVLSYLGYGEELLAVVLWPLAMFAVIGHFASLGFIVALGTFFTAIIGFAIGRLTDMTEKRTLLRLGAIFTGLSWVARVAVASPFAILGIESIYRSGRMAQGMPMTAMTYDRARQYSVTKTALLLEMAVVIGKISAALFALLLFLFAPAFAWPAVFMLAAAYTMLYFFF